MRRLIESLTPAERPISWTWIGTVLAFYALVMAVAVNLYVAHQTSASLAQKAGATVTVGPTLSSIGQSSIRSLGQFVRND